MSAPMLFPGPSALDMARAFRRVRADPLSFLDEVRDEFGDVAAFPVPGTPALLLSGPDDVRHVLQTSARRWTKNTVQYSALGRITGDGLLASAEPSWIEHRRAAAPAFHRHRLAAVSEHVVGATDEALRGWDVGRAGPGEVEVSEVMARLALDVVGRALFGSDLSGHAERLLDATSAAAVLVVKAGRSILPLPHAAPTPLNRRIRAARREFDRLSHEIISGRRRSTARRDGSGDDLLGLLLDAGLSDDEIRDELVTMVIAGHETVAAGLTWTLMLLAEHPSDQDDLHREAVGLPVPPPIVGAGAAAPLTRAVVDEALRLYPPAWAISRRAAAADAIGGRDVPAGTLAIISPWVVHRHPGLWEAPLDFRPERFAAGRDHRGAYLPFGAGPRLCIGREFALAEMVVVLTRVLADFRFDTPPGWSRPFAEARVALHPRGGMRLVVTSRVGSSA
ncbi:cytochrome P450 [Knoellia flava TL1]|uniref:Cytochrome P450 n=2 Tax=Knoellia flava TaxID=913969 RepID=A0A8H9FUJ8_9MICO|nr:cytochrome P450 [Knoellia flava]KGN33428.1 cytochrome P450 [Knoellia flava TL1]GGB74459.1 cytochrome P450 [Knoellia flava]